MTPERSIHSHLSADRVRVGVSVASKSELIDMLVDCAATAAEVEDADELLEGVRSRESRMSTGVGHGLALPHARTRAVSGTVVAIATLSEGVDFDSIDGEPVRIAVLLAGPEKDNGAHVRLLSRISRVMAREDVREALRQATTSAAVLEAFENAEQELA